MHDKVIFDLIRNSTSLLSLIRKNGDIIYNSRVFDDFITNKLPYENNFIELFTHAKGFADGFNKMFKDRIINCSSSPITIKINDNNTIYIECKSTFNVENEDAILICISQDSNNLDYFTENFIKSENLFTKNKKPSLIFDSFNSEIISVNNASTEFIAKHKFEDNNFPNNFIGIIKEVVANARIGGVYSKSFNYTLSEKNTTISFDCAGIDTSNQFFLVTFSDNTNALLNQEITTLDKERALNIINVVPGILFEFEVANNQLTFTYISESIKSLVGITASHILKDSKKLFSYLNKIERARLHYFFTSLTEDERKVKNEFKIKDSENNLKWITVNWHETQSKNGIIKGTGYIDDITEKKKIAIQNAQNLRRKQLKEYFAISLLKQSSISLLLKDLAISIVNKLSLQDIIIYTYNPDTMKLEYSASYSSTNIKGTRVTYPKEISIDKGIIGRVVNSLKSEIINYSSDDEDYYYIDRPSESEITVPIIFEGEILGIIDSEHTKPNFFSNEHLYLLEDIAEALAVRIVQKKRQEDNLKFHTTLSLIYNQGKIFDFNLNMKTKKFNDACIDNIISLIEISDTSEKIAIYNDSKILLKYILKYDLDILTNIEEGLEQSIVATKELTFRIITVNGSIKWLKINVSNISKNSKGYITNIEGTIQDTTKLEELKSKNKGLKGLQNSIKISKKQLYKTGDIIQSLDLIGHTINVSDIIISKQVNNKNYSLKNIIHWNTNGILKKDTCLISELVGFESLLTSNQTIEKSNFKNQEEVNTKLEFYGIKSFISIPIKTYNGFWGIITFIEESKKREWKEFEKDLLIVYSDSISLHIEKI